MSLHHIHPIYLLNAMHAIGFDTQNRTEARAPGTKMTLFTALGIYMFGWLVIMLVVGPGRKASIVTFYICHLIWIWLFFELVTYMGRQSGP